MREFLDISEYLGLPNVASAHGPEVDFLMALVHWLMLLLFVFWGAYYVYVLVRFRASRNPQASYEGTSGGFSKVQEAGVVAVEAVLLLAFAFPLWGFLKHDFPDAGEAFEVHVIAEQFTWNVHYAGADGVFGRRSADLVDVVSNPVGLDRSDPAAADDVTIPDELHLPVGRPAVIRLSSKDVIHSFGIPEMRIKQDAIPGLLIPIWFTPTVEGEYEIACAQLCGPSHYRMRGYVTVEPERDLHSWLAELAAEENF
jgi:cytochrome c oxidase subunit 2